VTHNGIAKFQHWKMHLQTKAMLSIFITGTIALRCIFAIQFLRFSLIYLHRFIISLVRITYQTSLPMSYELVSTRKKTTKVDCTTTGTLPISQKLFSSSDFPSRLTSQTLDPSRYNKHRQSRDYHCSNSHNPHTSMFLLAVQYFCCGLRVILLLKMSGKDIPTSLTLDGYSYSASLVVIHRLQWLLTPIISTFNRALPIAGILHVGQRHAPGL
jgi:hypothetical protein